MRNTLSFPKDPSYRKNFDFLKSIFFHFYDWTVAVIINFLRVNYNLEQVAQWIRAFPSISIRVRTPQGAEVSLETQSYCDAPNGRWAEIVTQIWLWCSQIVISACCFSRKS